MPTSVPIPTSDPTRHVSLRYSEIPNWQIFIKTQFFLNFLFERSTETSKLDSLTFPKAGFRILVKFYQSRIRFCLESCPRYKDLCVSLTMTYNDEEAEVPVLKTKRMERNREYVVLRTENLEEELGGAAEMPPSPRKRRWWWWWVKVVLLCVFGIAAAVVSIIWVIPFLLHKEVVPLLDWEIRTFRPEVLGILLFSSLVLFPSLLVPSTPSIWVAGISFGYFFGFLLTLPGMCVGMSIPYFIGSLFRHKIQAWLERWPEKAAFMRLAGEGSWFQQFRTVVLLRISPFPFILYNYAAVATNVKYGPYLVGSVVGVVPEIFVTIYSGILIRTLADVSQSHTTFSKSQIICNVLGFIATTASTVTITIYARRALKKLQDGEELLLE